MNASLARYAVAAASAALLLAGCSSTDDAPTRAADTTSADASTPEATATASAAPSAPSATESASACPSAAPAADAVPVVLTGGSGRASVIAATKTTAPKVTVDGEYRVDATSTVVAQAGTGAEATKDAVVTVCYQGVNGRTGKVFDDAFARGESVEFALPEVVRGFSAALTGQKVGASVITSVTSADGYPQGQSDADIKPGDTLIFVITLLAVE